LADLQIKDITINSHNFDKDLLIYFLLPKKGESSTKTIIRRKTAKRKVPAESVFPPAHTFEKIKIEVTPRIKETKRLPARCRYFL